ncbi:hypothetical protein DERF_001653 [Dermatophagoides farinae]|uniref:Uncharacterized protein n=1 Tax=Dermatophagoides farinae TaxID=6954 RepID=A0A922IC85_DERFA|nr:hypothetical protein DERF_001653 [Dermatophagoides farinae]
MYDMTKQNKPYITDCIVLRQQYHNNDENSSHLYKTTRLKQIGPEKKTNGQLSHWYKNKQILRVK